ncbi:MAG: HD-GYP domain-containing protein [Planctomycetota bacterium]|jgi:HD-GYP domain-containing protein (c-di-GMP phosphodiesterase class II)
MDPNRSLEIKTKRINVGMTFDFDLTDKTGQVVLKAGEPFDETVRQNLLDAGVESLTIMVKAQPELATRALLDSYPAESVERLQNTINLAERALNAFVEELTINRRANCDSLRGQVDRILFEATNDPSALLGVLAARWSMDLKNESQRLGKRATRLSCLSMIAGMKIGLNPSDLKLIGLAGLMHDVSMFFHPEWQDPKYRALHHREFMAAYQKHSVESTEYLSLTAGLGQQALLMISQIHEQVDGSGIPRGLNGAQILYGAKILNVVDAYLEIVDPMFRSNGIIPSDALGQLCFHANRGVFDREAVQSLIEAVSYYPVGTEVDLSDSRRAVVIRTIAGKPLEPVVRLLDGSDEILDLHQTALSIIAPATGGIGGRRLRIQTEMEIPWWDALTKTEFQE